MVKTAYSALNGVDAICVLVNASEKMGPGDQFVIDKVREAKVPVFLVVNKIDLIHPDDLLPLIEGYQALFNFEAVVPISAKEGINIQALLDTLVAKMPNGPQYYPADQVMDHPEYFVVSELIREKILLLTREEIPHSVAVQVHSMQRNPDDKVEVQASIIVERKSQKGIIIGHQGKMIKKIGSLARRDIENLLADKVYLDLWVKVQKDWRDRQANLNDLGYRLENY